MNSEQLRISRSAAPLISLNSSLEKNIVTRFVRGFLDLGLPTCLRMAYSPKRLGLTCLMISKLNNLGNSFLYASITAAVGTDFCLDFTCI